MTARAKAREATAVLWCRLAVQLCAGLLSALIAGHAVAADFREEGLGGTGVAPMDEGVGGTGLTAGGDDDGIGGTGIMGTITGFGSILANGLKVEYDGGTPVEIDGQPASAGELAIGQVTTIEAERIGEELRARRISLHFEVTGPLAGFDLARGELSVLGQTVKLGSGARVYDRGLGQSLEASDLRVGDFVRVSGLRRGDGVIVASRLERGPPQHEVRLSGPVSKVESGAFRLAGLRLGFLPEVSAIAPGKRVIVSGLWERGKLRAVHVRPEPEELFSARLEEISVEGYATDRGRNGSFRLHGLEVDLSELEDEERRQLPRVDGGVRVRVSGRLHAGHRVAALQIDFEDEERGGWISLRARSEEREELRLASAPRRGSLATSQCVQRRRWTPMTTPTVTRKAARAWERMATRPRAQTTQMTPTTTQTTRPTSLTTRRTRMAPRTPTPTRTTTRTQTRTPTRRTTRRSTPTTPRKMTRTTTSRLP